MHSVHIQKIGNVDHVATAGFSIQKDENISFVCVCHTPTDALTKKIHHICTDHIVDTAVSETNALRIFTEVLEKINISLDEVYKKNNKKSVSLFIGLVLRDHIHFSIFGDNLSGMIVSSKNIEDVFADMDSGEGKFVYDSHGDIGSHETLYIFGPKVDTHVIGEECQHILHLGSLERIQLLAERIERSYIYKDSIIMGISREDITTVIEEQSTPPKQTARGSTKPWIDSLKESSIEKIETAQSQFTHLSKNIQNWTIFLGLIVSVVFLYLIITGMMQGQFHLFVPQKYRETLAEARVNLSEATRMSDQPESFGPKLSHVKELVKIVESADVLKIEVQEIKNEISTLEKSVNKITTLRTEEYKPIYSFNKNIDSVPFSIYTKDKKLYFVTTESILGPIVGNETPKEFPIPNNEKIKFSDVDGEGRIYLGTDRDRVYLFEKGRYTTLNMLQVGGWDRAVGMNVYNSNIYLLSEDGKQIFKYRRQSENTYGGSSLVIAPDTQKDRIISTDIDGSVWLLTGNNKLGTEKIITSPRYERRSIPILSMGTNTITNIDSDATKIYAGESLQEIYMLVDGKIWIFIPNKKRYTDVTNIVYAGQIDVPNVTITDIAVEQDGDVREIFFGSPKSGIFSTKVTLRDNKLQILTIK